MERNSENKERWRSAQLKEDDFWQRNGVINDQMERVRSRYGPVIKRLSENLDSETHILDM